MIEASVQTLAVAVGNGIATEFPYNFKAFELEDIRVKVRLIATGAETLLVAGIDYSVTGVGQPEGTVALVNNAQAWLNGGGALLATYEIHIDFVPNVKQLSKFTDLGRHAPTLFERSLDRLTMFLKGLLGPTGDIAKSVKLPDNLNANDFDPTLPSDINTADSVLMTNPTADGFVLGPSIASMTDMAQFLATAYAPGAVQSLGAGGTVVIAQLRRQHVRIQSTGGELALNAQPFGANPALFQDGMEIVVEGVHAANYMTIAENDAQYGFIGNGGAQLKRGTALTFLYNATLERFILKSLGAW